MPKAKSPQGDHLVMLRSAVLCDIVRTESTGKKLLVGCYEMGVILNRKPALFSAVIIGAFEVLVPGKHRVTYRVRAPSIEGRGGFEMDEANEEGSFVPFEASIQCLIEENSVAILDWSVDEGEWSRPVRWNLQFAPDAVALDKKAATDLRSKYWGKSWPMVRKAMSAAEQ